MKRSVAVVLFLLWTGILLSIYYVVQKSGLLNAFTSLTDTLWTLMVAGWLLFHAYGIGTLILPVSPLLPDARHYLTLLRN